MGSIPHPAATLLEHYRTQGTSVDTPPKPWTDTQKQDALQRGAHKSSYDHLDFVQEEFADFVRKKYWVVLPAADVLMLEWLMLSPLGVVPQVACRPRLICDYTYHLVNQLLSSGAPPEAMQFGHALRRVLWILA